DLSCFKYISVDEDGLTFNFQQYQVACYAAGMPSITVSYNDLKDLFTPASPIYSIVKAAVHDNAETTKTAMK
uniref:RsiV family protein n=1 Tax=Parvibaculum sp. TaxID=2024848 RepID=UPI003BABDC1C